MNIYIYSYTRGRVLLVIIKRLYVGQKQYIARTNYMHRWMTEQNNVNCYSVTKMFKDQNEKRRITEEQRDASIDMDVVSNGLHLDSGVFIHCISNSITTITHCTTKRVREPRRCSLLRLYLLTNTTRRITFLGLRQPVSSLWKGVLRIRAREIIIDLYTLREMIILILYAIFKLIRILVVISTLYVTIRAITEFPRGFEFETLVTNYFQIPNYTTVIILQRFIFSSEVPAIARLYLFVSINKQWFFANVFAFRPKRVPIIIGYTESRRNNDVRFCERKKELGNTPTRFRDFCWFFFITPAESY